MFQSNMPFLCNMIWHNANINKKFCGRIFYKSKIRSTFTMLRRKCCYNNSISIIHLHVLFCTHDIACENLPLILVSLKRPPITSLLFTTTILRKRSLYQSTRSHYQFKMSYQLRCMIRDQSPLLLLSIVFHFVLHLSPPWVLPC